ncbi:hypothetical protein EDB83DRAFT_2361116 [Lactarius deliciosus]|nr:hypothetical protein EDB83DRAFT_2361116 [Lactarius deliciosus]
MEEPVIFGLLADCSHVLCIDCIRNWRGQESSSEDVTFSCLHIPLERYKARSLQQIPCRYFTTSNPDCRYCPFGRDHVPTSTRRRVHPIFSTKGPTFIYQYQRVRMRGIFNSAAVNRSLYAYVRNIRAIFASREHSEVGLPDDPANDSESDVTMYFTVPSMISAPEHNPDAPTPEPVPTVFSSPSTPTLSTPLRGPPLVPEPSHIPTLHDTQSHDDPTLCSIPSSPLSVGFLPSLTTSFDTDPDFSDPVSTCSLPDSYQDSRLLQPANEPAAIPDTASPHSPSPFLLPLSDACGPLGAVRPYDDNPLSTVPISPLRDIGESDSLQSTQGAAAGIPSSAGEPHPGGAPDTRHQEPPFMTDGRGRVRGSSPLAIRSSSYPQYILKSAARLNNDQETVGSKYFSLYGKILDYWFPPVNGYDICPHWTPDYTNSEEFNVTFVIEYKQRPFLLLEVKPSCDFHRDLGREGAINQIHELFDEVGPTNKHAERLYGISAIGKRWRAGYVTKGNGSEGGGGHPVRGVAEVDSLTSADPNCWNPNVTSDASWSALQKSLTRLKATWSNTQFSPCILTMCSCSGSTAP